jgi:hypothetical protein
MGTRTLAQWVEAPMSIRDICVEIDAQTRNRHELEFMGIFSTTEYILLPYFFPAGYRGTRRDFVLSR